MTELNIGYCELHAKPRPCDVCEVEADEMREIEAEIDAEEELGRARSNGIRRRFDLAEGIYEEFLECGASRIVATPAAAQKALRSWPPHPYS